MPVRLINSLTTNPQVDDVFSDASVIQAMVRFEVALAHVEGRLGVIPVAAAESIQRAADVGKLETSALATASCRAPRQRFHSFNN